MPNIMIKALELNNENHLLNLNNLDKKQNKLSEIDDKSLKQVYGGRLPNDNELAIIIALKNTNPSRNLTGAILDDKSISINIAVFAPGSYGNVSNQINV